MCAAAAPALPPAASSTTLACNGTTSVNATVPLSSVIAFPAAANVADATPLVFLPAATPLNTFGVDVIVAAVEQQKTWRQWREGFIPLPTTWLFQERWNDEPEPARENPGA